MKQKTTYSTIFLLMLLFTVSSFVQEDFNREILPIVVSESQTYTELDIRRQ